MSEDKDLYGAMMYKLCIEVGNLEGANRFRKNYNDYWARQRVEDARRQREIQEAQEKDKKSVTEKNESEKQEELQRQETMWSEVSAEQVKRDEEEPQVQGAPSLGGLSRLWGSRGGRKHKSPRRKNKTRKSRKARRLYKSKRRRS